jgi:hypothetical protein
VAREDAARDSTALPKRQCRCCRTANFRQQHRSAWNNARERLMLLTLSSFHRRIGAGRSPHLTAGARAPASRN